MRTFHSGNSAPIPAFIKEIMPCLQRWAGFYSLPKSRKGRLNGPMSYVSSYSFVDSSMMPPVAPPMVARIRNGARGLGNEIRRRGGDSLRAGDREFE